MRYHPAYAGLPRLTLFFLIGLLAGPAFAADLPEHGCLTKAEQRAARRLARGAMLPAA